MQKQLKQNLKKRYTFFKRFRNEIGFITGSLVLLISYLNYLKIPPTLENFITYGIILTGVILIVSFPLGAFLLKKVDTQQPIENPYSQDVALSELYERYAWIEYWQGNITEATRLMELSIKHYTRWLSKANKAVLKIHLKMG